MVDSPPVHLFDGIGHPMTRRVTPDDLHRLAGQLTALADLMRSNPDCRCKCPTRADHALKVATDTHGAPGSNLDAGRSAKGDHSDPTVSQLLNPEPSDHWLDDLSIYTRGASRFAQELARLVHDLGGITSTNPRKLTATGSGDCMACGRYCSGAASDRLRSGLCPSDYIRWVRAGRPDRFEFCRATPMHDDEQAAS